MATKQEGNPTHSPLPDLGDLIFLGLMYLLFALRPDFLYSDASTGWHIAAGNYIIANHEVPVRDLFSYTFAGKAWVDYEWLTHVIMSLLVKAGGLPLLAVVCGTLIGTIFLLLYERCRNQGCHFIAAVAVILIGEIAASVHWLVRPHLVTFIGVFVFSTTLEDYYSKSISLRKMLIRIGCCMLFWVNCHPGFLFGLGILAIYLGSALLQWLVEDSSTDKEWRLARLRGLFAATMTALPATLANPYGFGLYKYIVNYLCQSNVLSATNELQTPVFHGSAQSLSLEALYGLLIVGLAITTSRLSLPTLLMTLAFAHFSLANIRNIPLFIIVVVPVIAKLLARTNLLTTDSGAPGILSNSRPMAFLAQKLSAVDANFSKTESTCKSHLLPIFTFLILAILASSGANIAGVKLVNSGFSSAEVPTRNLDTINRLKLNPKEGFSYDNWGGYLAYKLGIPVFIDDRADFYGDRFYTDYGVVCETAPSWETILDKYHINWVLFPTNSNLVQALKEKSDWQLAATDEASSLLLRKPKSQQQNH